MIKFYSDNTGLLLLLLKQREKGRKTIRNDKPCRKKINNVCFRLASFTSVAHTDQLATPACPTLPCEVLAASLLPTKRAGCDPAQSSRNKAQITIIVERSRDSRVRPFITTYCSVAFCGSVFALVWIYLYLTTTFMEQLNT